MSGVSTPASGSIEGDEVRELKLDDFAGNIGKEYEIVFTDGVLPLILEQAQELPGGQRKEGAFRLQFLGPVHPILPQGVFSFRFGDESDDIFIVPVGEVADGINYEAIFS
jgi:hypothetical protein